MEKKLQYLDWLSSGFFHKLYAGTTANEAEPFINQLVQYLQPAPGSRVLDSACGTGFNCRHLAAKGFDVTGVDAATANIEAAKPMEKEGLEFYLHDLRLPFWGNYFHVALNLFTSFGFYRTRREHDNAIRTIASGLQSNGLLVIDYPNTHYEESRLKTQESKQLGETQYEWKRWQTETSFFKTITVSDPSLPAPLEYNIERAKFSLGDFTDMLSFQKMQVQEVFGNYQLAPYHLNDTPRLIVIAKKID